VRELRCAKWCRYRRNCRLRSHLTVVCWNAAGLRGKASELQLWLIDNKVNVVAIQEVEFAAKRTVRLYFDGNLGSGDYEAKKGAVGRRRWMAVKGGDVAIYDRSGLLFQRLGYAPLRADDEVTSSAVWCLRD
jgi:hypothetical protein